MNNAKLWGICLDIYQQMYSEAEPKADFKQLMKDKVTAQQEWFMDYYLPMERQVEIVEQHIKKHRLTKQDADKICFTVYLGSAPNSCKEGE